MIEYIKRKLARRKARKYFSEYGTGKKQFNLSGVGPVEYMQWLHPLESPKEITAGNVSFYRRLCREGSFVIDIGAHTGDTTVPMAIAAGKTGLVLALEPNPYVYKVLAANSKLNKQISNIEPVCFAATETDGKFEFNYSDASFCNGGFLSQIKEGEHGHVHTLTVEGKNLQRFLQANYRDRLKSLDLIKVDAEGYDKDILKSIPDIIAEFKPNLLLECYKRLTTDERSELYDVVDGHGYELYRIEGFEGDNKTRILRNQMNDEKHFEIMALHPQRKQGVSN
jgi:FkbM family methyltransferase